MLSRELKLAVVMISTSILLSFVFYKILLGGDYLSGIAALGLVVLAVLLTSLAFHVRHARKVFLPAVAGRVVAVSNLITVSMYMKQNSSPNCSVR
jgi:hypothetical protein